jgi:hypothetical protein
MVMTDFREAKFDTQRLSLNLAIHILTSLTLFACSDGSYKKAIPKVLSGQSSAASNENGAGTPVATIDKSQDATISENGNKLIPVNILVEITGDLAKSVNFQSLEVILDCDQATQVTTGAQSALDETYSNCQGFLQSFSANDQSFTRNVNVPWFAGESQTFASGETVSEVTLVAQLASPLENPSQLTFRIDSWNELVGDFDAGFGNAKYAGEVLVSGEPLSGLKVARVFHGGPGKLRVESECDGNIAGSAQADATCEGDLIGDTLVLALPYNGETLNHDFFAPQLALVKIINQLGYEVRPAVPGIDRGGATFRIDVTPGSQYVIAHILPGSGSIRYSVIGI